MFRLVYKLNKDVVARDAVNLQQDLGLLKSTVHIVANDRVINAKSLIGILSAKMEMGNRIEVNFDEIEDKEAIIESFDKIGKLEEGIV